MSDNISFQSCNDDGAEDDEEENLLDDGDIRFPSEISGGGERPSNHKSRQS